MCLVYRFPADINFIIFLLLNSGWSQPWNPYLASFEEGEMGRGPVPMLLKGKKEFKLIVTFWGHNSNENWLSASKDDNNVRNQHNNKELESHFRQDIFP